MGPSDLSPVMDRNAKRGRVPGAASLPSHPSPLSPVPHRVSHVGETAGATLAVVVGRLVAEDRGTSSVGRRRLWGGPRRLRRQLCLWRLGDGGVAGTLRADASLGPHRSKSLVAREDPGRLSSHHRHPSDPLLCSLSPIWLPSEAPSDPATFPL